MTTARINNINKWIHQNNAECIDFAEGCLLDNYIYACKNGTAFIFEEYVNPNSSCYRMEFFREHECESREFLEAEKHFQNLIDAMEEQYN